MTVHGMHFHVLNDKSQPFNSEIGDLVLRVLWCMFVVQLAKGRHTETFTVLLQRSSQILETFSPVEHISGNHQLVVCVPQDQRATALFSDVNTVIRYFDFYRAFRGTFPLILEFSPTK